MEGDYLVLKDCSCSFAEEMSFSQVIVISDSFGAIKSIKLSLNSAGIVVVT